MIKNLLRAFRYRNYRLFFMGQSISLFGTWMQQVAVSWLAYRLTRSAFLLGLIGFSSQIMTFICAPLAGVVADRVSRHKILIVTQLLSMVQAFSLAALWYSGHVSIVYLILLSLSLGLVNAFDIPARQSFVADMIEKRNDLGNAIALNSTMFNGARFIGPVAAGFMIAAGGEGLCFLLNAFSFIAVITSLQLMKFGVREKKHDAHVIDGLKEGFHYVFGSPPIRSILFVVGMVSLLGMPYHVLLPVFAKEILKGGPKTLGFLLSATGVGALLGALYLASRKNVHGLGGIISAGGLIFGAGLAGFSISRSLPISLVLMVIMGFGVMVQMASCNTVLQTIVDDHMRGRAMSFYTMCFMGVAPFGSLLIGTAASRFGASRAVMIGALSCFVVSIFFTHGLPAFSRHIRRIYIQKGIIQESELSGI